MRSSGQFGTSFILFFTKRFYMYKNHKKHKKHKNHKKHKKQKKHKDATKQKH